MEEGERRVEEEEWREKRGEWREKRGEWGEVGEEWREAEEGRREAAGENTMEKGKRESVTDLLYALQSNLGNITAYL